MCYKTVVDAAVIPFNAVRLCTEAPDAVAAFRLQKGGVLATVVAKLGLGASIEGSISWLQQQM